MSLRTKLLALFAALALVPLIAIGVFDYLRSVRAVEELTVTQTSMIAARADSELTTRFATLQANVSLLAENAEAPALYERPGASADATRYLAGVWSNIGRGLQFIAYRDKSAAEVYRIGAAGVMSAAYTGDAEAVYVVTDSVRDARTRRTLGSVQVGAKLDSLLPRAVLDVYFGRAGRTFVFDRSRGDVLFQGGATSRAGPSPALMAAVANGMSAPTLRVGSASLIKFREDGSTNLGVLRDVANTPFAVLALASLDEFAGPFSRIRDGNLALVLTTTVVVAIAFVALLWRATGSLSALTRAAEDVRHGNLSPDLPARAPDEVGRLATAFDLMLARLRTMMTEIEHSRQMAAVGEFAAQISHEIRNPLTSIKLNLQKLERAARDGVVPAELGKPIDISLREIQRLDRVVRGVLRLGRGARSTSTTFVLADAVTSAAEGLRVALDRLGVSVRVEPGESPLRVTGDQALVESVFVNLIMNAADAMPGGGTVHLSVDATQRDGAVMARVRVEDEGHGIAPGDRARVFSPFFSTKPEGTGLGLALALRTVEEHSGRMTLDETYDRGAAFVVELPATPA